MSDPVAPGYIRRRQENNGTFISAARIPNALEISKARKQIYFNGKRCLFVVKNINFYNLGNKADVDALPSVIRNGGGPGSSFKISKSQPMATPASQKRGALMQKTLKMMKGRLRR